MKGYYFLNTILYFPESLWWHFLLLQTQTLPLCEVAAASHQLSRVKKCEQVMFVGDYCS